MNFCILGSGSKGNCILIESGSTSILVDAGFSGKEINRRLALVNRSPESLKAILVTHEHCDHVGGVGILSRQLQLPVYANFGTYCAAEAKLGKLHERAEFETGRTFIVDDLEIHPFSTSHDAADPVGFSVSDGECSICCCTDTGRITGLIRQTVRHCHALVLEANYDPRMLANGPYPLPIKQRVRSSRGHLANDEAARFLAELADSCLQKVVLAHISEANNLPELAYSRIRQEIDPLNPPFSVDLAFQKQPTPIMAVQRPSEQRHS